MSFSETSNVKEGTFESWFLLWLTKEGT